MNLSKNKQTILIVDDAPQNLEMISVILKSEAYQTITAENGLKALELADSRIPDLILLDVTMPELGGFETCRRLKTNPKTQDIPVIFLTSRTEQKSIVKGLALGAVDYVTHPFDYPELLVRVQTHLRNHLLHVELQRQFDDNNRLRREQEKFLRHELRNMLTPIQGYAEILSVLDGLNPQCKEYADFIFNGTQKILALVEDLKKLQEIETGSVEVHKDQVNLVAVLCRQIDRLNVLFGDRTTITIQNAPQSLDVVIDAEMFSEVFHNLIKNALEHVCELSDDSDREITIEISENLEDITVSINNRGPIIPPENLDTFFEKFNAQNKQHGTGLGTTYAYWVTRVHEGDITVTSNEVEGTTVSVHLPRS